MDKFNFKNVKNNLLNKDQLISSIRTKDWNLFYNSFDYPYLHDKDLKDFLVSRLTINSKDQYLKYLRYLLKEDKFLSILQEQVCKPDEITYAKILVLLPCIFSVDKNHTLGEKTIQLLCEHLADASKKDPKINKDEIRNSCSALRKYGFFLEQYQGYDNIPNVNSKIRGILQSCTSNISFSYEELYDKLDWSMWTQDRLKPSTKGYCYPIRLIGSLLKKEEKDALMSSCIDNIKIYRKEEDPYRVSDLKKNGWKLQLQEGRVMLDKGISGIETVYDCDGEVLKAYVGSDISIEHEYSIANILEDENYMSKLDSLKKLSELIWEICDIYEIAVTNTNVKKIYNHLKNDKETDLENRKKGLFDNLNQILNNEDIKIELSLMNTAKNSSKGKHD